MRGFCARGGCRAAECSGEGSRGRKRIEHGRSLHEGKYAEGIFLAAQLFLFPLGTALQNDMKKGFIRQKEPAALRKTIRAGQYEAKSEKKNGTLDRLCMHSIIDELEERLLDK